MAQLDPGEVIAALATRMGLTTRYQIAPPGRPPVWAGLDVDRAAVVELVPVGDPARWVLTPGLVRPREVRDAAQVALDTRLLRLAEVLADPGSPMELLLLVTDGETAVPVLLDTAERTGLAAHSLVLSVSPDGAITERSPR